MILTKEQYDKMMQEVTMAIANCELVDVKVAASIGVEYDSLVSLYGQVFVRNLKAEFRSSTDIDMNDIIQRFRTGESLLNMFKKFRMGANKFAKLYLEACNYSNVQLSSLLLDPEQITDVRLRKEILCLMEMDPICAYDVEQLKECLGREYEELLIGLLNNKKMCFETESELRSRGKPKTPDILFLIPMATVCSQLDFMYYDHQHSLRNSKDSKVVINWIDSKAMFADVLTFKENLDQFRAYNNRYGRGMVIYWHGFVEEICTSMLSDDMIVVRDHFPNEWIFPTGEIADGRTPMFDQIDL